MKKSAFTLSEAIVVLVIIGVITAITMPVIQRAIPDSNIIKFKKAHETLYAVVNELLTSDKYGSNGDLAKLPNSLFSNGFCTAFADAISTKQVNCYSDTSTTRSSYLLSNELMSDVTYTCTPLKRTVTDETIAASKAYFDESCKYKAHTMGEEIITTDNIVFYNAGTSSFGQLAFYMGGFLEGGNCSYNPFSEPNKLPAVYGDQNGFDIAYKIFCIDVDGIPENATTSLCINECPFGYGIRRDGKIVPGAKADEWLEKSLQNED